MNKWIILLLIAALAGGLYIGFAKAGTKQQSPLSQELIVPLSQTYIPIPTQAPEKNSQYVPKPLSLDTIFALDKSWLTTLPAERVRTITIPGDIIPARSVNMQTLSRQSFTWPYEKSFALLRRGDITFANVETPFLKDCKSIDSGFTFCGVSDQVNGLVYGGVDVVSLANNHAGNYGVEGVDETKKLLEQNQIAVTGTGDIVCKDIRSKKFAFVGFNDIGVSAGVEQATEENIRKTIGKAKVSCGIVVVMFHWGSEYRSQPDQRQIYLSHFTLDAGADLIVSNHPHWVQPVELYKGKLIMYAHGNFIFDQMWSEETKRGVVGYYTFYDDTLIDATYVPIKIFDYGQPRDMTGTDEGKLILNSLKEESLKRAKL